MADETVCKKMTRKADKGLEGKVIAKRGKKTNQKLKPYVVLEYLMKYSDENNTKSAYDIIGFALRLLSQYAKIPAGWGRVGRQTDLPGRILNTDSVVFYYIIRINKKQERKLRLQKRSRRGYPGPVWRLRAGRLPLPQQKP